MRGDKVGSRSAYEVNAEIGCGPCCAVKGNGGIASRSDRTDGHVDAITISAGAAARAVKCNSARIGANRSSEVNAIIAGGNVAAVADDGNGAIAAGLNRAGHGYAVIISTGIRTALAFYHNVTASCIEGARAGEDDTVLRAAGRCAGSIAGRMAAAVQRAAANIEAAAIGSNASTDIDIDIAGAACRSVDHHIVRSTGSIGDASILKIDSGWRDERHRSAVAGNERADRCSDKCDTVICSETRGASERDRCISGRCNRTAGHGNTVIVAATIAPARAAEGDSARAADNRTATEGNTVIGTACSAANTI